MPDRGRARLSFVGCADVASGVLTSRRIVVRPSRDTPTRSALRRPSSASPTRSRAGEADNGPGRSSPTESRSRELAPTSAGPPVDFGMNRFRYSPPAMSSGYETAPESGARPRVHVRAKKMLARRRDRADEVFIDLETRRAELKSDATRQSSSPPRATWDRSTRAVRANGGRHGVCLATSRRS